MAYCTKADVVRLSSVFSTLSDDDFTFWAEQSLEFLNPTALGDRKRLANAYLIAHLITATQGSSGRAIASKSVGGSSASFDTSASASARSEIGKWFQSTTFGQAYWAIMQLAARGMFV